MEEVGATLNRGLEGSRVPEIAPHFLHLQACQSRMVRIPHQHPHRTPGGQEFHHHGPAHKPGAAGDQGFFLSHFCQPKLPGDCGNLH